MESSGIKVYGGGMLSPPVIIQDGELLEQGGCFDVLIQVAINFFKWVSSLFTCHCANSTINAEISALDEEMTTGKKFSFRVGSKDEPRRDCGTGDPQIAHKITATSASSLKQVEGTNIFVQREVKGKVESGFSGYNVIDSDGKPFDFGGEAQESLELIAGCAGMEVAEAFSGLTISNPVSVFQIMLQNHFDPKEQSEADIELQLGMEHGIGVFNQVEKSRLTLLPSQGDGAFRFVVEADENFGKLVENKLVRSYRVRQEVTIYPGKESNDPAHVEMIRSARSVRIK